MKKHCKRKNNKNNTMQIQNNIVKKDEPESKIESIVLKIRFKVLMLNVITFVVFFILNYIFSYYSEPLRMTGILLMFVNSYMYMDKIMEFDSKYSRFNR